MAYLTEADLPTVCPKMAELAVDDVTTYLRRANSYAKGYIGGQLPEEHIDDELKAAVGLAFEIMATGETATPDPITGNIAEIGPQGFFIQKKPDPLATVDKMLRPYKALYESLNVSAPTTERGMAFLGGTGRT